MEMSFIIKFVSDELNDLRYVLPKNVSQKNAKIIKYFGEKSIKNNDKYDKWFKICQLANSCKGSMNFDGKKNELLIEFKSSDAQKSFLNLVNENVQ